MIELMKPMIKAVAGWLAAFVGTFLLANLKVDIDVAALAAIVESVIVGVAIYFAPKNQDKEKVTNDG